MTDAASDRTADPELAPLDDPDAPGTVPHPEHHLGVPAAPATSPPEAPLVPSNAAIGAFWSLYGPTALLIAVGLAIVAVILMMVGNS